MLCLSYNTNPLRSKASSATCISFVSQSRVIFIIQIVNICRDVRQIYKLERNIGEQRKCELNDRYLYFPLFISKFTL